MKTAYGETPRTSHPVPLCETINIAGLLAVVIATPEEETSIPVRHRFQ